MARGVAKLVLPLGIAWKESDSVVSVVSNKTRHERRR